MESGLRSRIIIGLLALTNTFGIGLKAEDSEPKTVPGLEFSATLTNDTQGVIKGGLKKGTASTSTLDLIADLNTKEAGLWSGGKFHAYVLGLMGGTTSSYTGALQPVSSLDASDTIKLFEAYYEHEFNDAQWRLAVGVQNKNADFYVSEYAGLFMHSSPGMGPELTQTGLPAYPSSAFGIAIKGNPTDHTYVQFAAYDGVPDHSDGEKGTHFGHHSGDGYYLAEEVGFMSAEDEADKNFYKVAFGAWQKTSDYQDVNGNDRDSAHGFYSFIDKSLTHEEDDGTQGLGMFVQAGFTDGERQQVDTYYGAGINYTGLFCGRDHDVLGVGVYRAGVSNHFKRANAGTNGEETAIELTYRAEITDWLSLQPDLQFIHNPGPTSGVHDAWVMGLRTQMSF